MLFGMPAGQDPHRKARDALAGSVELRAEVARMRLDFRRDGKSADHLSDEQILGGIQQAGRKLPTVSGRPGGAGFAAAKRQFAAQLPDL